MLIFPILSIISVYIDICLCMGFVKKTERHERLLAALYCISIHTFILLAANELLSLSHNIHFLSLSLLWGMTAFSGFLFMFIIIKKKNISLSTIKNCFTFSNTVFTPITIFLIVVCGTACFFSIKTTPYNWDSMTYHLTRLTHWTQNRSIAHYVCHDISQISAPPLAEFINLHVYILSGHNDYFVNLLQTFSYIISVFLVYKISSMTGCRPLFSSLAALVFATTPIAFGEALTTQVDMYSAMWLLIFVYSVLHFTDKNQNLDWNIATILKLFLMGSSAGFCYLSKPSTMIAVVVFAFWLLLVCIRRRDKLITVIKSVTTVPIIGLAVILPELTRNFITFHSISAAETGTGFLVPPQIRYLLVNLIQNVGFNLPNRYFDIMDFIDKAVFKSMYILYTGTQIPDRQLNFKLIEPSMSHDTAISPTIIWLIIFAVLCSLIICLYRLFTKNKSTSQNLSYGFIITSITSFLLFCAVVQWYKFITRYEIGYLALLSPVIMLLFQYVFDRNDKLIYAFAGIIVFTCSITFVDLVQYHAQPVKSKEDRISQYFFVRIRYSPYQEISNQIIDNGYKNIGFICGPDSYEYPFWKMMEDSIERFEHVCVTNETAVYNDESFSPDCIIAVDVEITDTIEYHDITYKLASDIEGVKLFECE